MLLLIPIFILLTVLFIFRIRNKSNPYPSTLKLINRTIYGIWFISFVFSMINMGDANPMQFSAALGFIFVTTLAVIILVVTNAMRLKCR